MEKTSGETTEGPVLLSWQFPALMRTVAKLVFCLIFVPSILAVGVLGIYNATGDPVGERLFHRFYLWASLALVISAVVCSKLLCFGSVGIECRNSGITITSLFARPRRMRWNEVVRLSKNRAGHIVLQYGDRVLDDVRLPFPPDVRDKLIAILREKSDARIIGFDSEAG